MNEPLDLERFRALTLAYGGRLERWPSAERDSARALCAESAEARALLSAEAGLDAALASAAPAPDLPPELWRRLNELPVRAPQRRIFWPFQRAWIPAVSWALAAVVGVVWGLESAPFERLDADAARGVATVESVSPDALAADDDLDALVGGALAEFEE
jgi:hypothetical protein